MRHYDIAVLGGGLAGLSLLYHLINQQKLIGLKVVLVDEAGRRNEHDRTWSFWEKSPGPFEDIVEHRWKEVTLHDEGRDLRCALAPYTYKIIRSPVFYEKVNKVIDACPAITRVQGRVVDIDASSPGVKFGVGGERYRSDTAFSSIPLHLRPRQIAAPYLDQHFRGWFITTPTPTFDPDVATLMDFRTEQHGETRFLYVLPLSPTKALVEVAIFSNEHLRAEAYDEILHQYLHEHWGGTYQVEHVEAGNIPMTTYPFALRERDLIYIGMRGGATRPSTGYTFYNLQRQLQELASDFPGAVPKPWPRRHRLYDDTILRILQENRLAGAAVFMDLFARNPPPRLLSFLNGESSVAQEVAVMATTRMGKFAKAFAEAVFAKMMGADAGAGEGTKQERPA